MVYRRTGRKGWWFSYRDSSSKQYQKWGGQTRHAAALAERELVLSLSPLPPTDLNRFVEEQYWPGQKAHLSPKSIERESGIINKHLGPAFSGMMGSIDRSRILAYTNLRLKAGASRESVRKELNILKHLLRIAVKLEFLARNPFQDLEQKDWPAKGEERTRHLSPEEWNALLLHLPKEKRAAAILLVNTGLRRGELFSLEWTDLDFRKGVGYLKKTKPRKPRWFFLTGEMVECLKSIPRIKGNPKVFSTFTPNALTMAIRRAAKAAGLADFRLHDLRHTFATSVRQRGHGLDVLQDLLGHSDPRQTRRYAHLGDEQLDQAARSIAGVFTMEPIEPEKKEKVN
jgi:integrase